MSSLEPSQAREWATKAKHSCIRSWNQGVDTVFDPVIRALVSRGL